VLVQRYVKEYRDIFFAYQHFYLDLGKRICDFKEKAGAF
jgi:hypothetical protein